MNADIVSSRRAMAAAWVAAWAAAWAALAAFIVYLEWGTGFATDDYVLLWQALNQPLAENLLPKTYLSVPTLHYTNGLAFFLLGDRAFAYDLLKALYLGLSVYGVCSFFSLFCARPRAMVLAFLFVFFPLHDAASYSFTALYLITSFSALLYAYALAERGRYKTAAAIALVASFASYGSTPIVIGLAVLGWLRGHRAISLCLLVPNAVYAAYYVVTSLVLQVGIQRLTGEFGIGAIARQYLLQLVTFADAALGPSAWLKIVYSLTSLHVGSLLAGMLGAALLLVLLGQRKRDKVDPKLLLAAVIILLGSFGIFAMTGLYPQLAFSLGDRIMVYAAFFLICLLAVAPLPRMLERGIAILLVLAISGIASHWKDWGAHVGQIAAHARNNAELRALPAGTPVYVSHNQYSRLGPYAHIDFFTASYVVRTFFQLVQGPQMRLDLHSFNRRLAYEDGTLRDRKYGDVTRTGASIFLYNSETDALTQVATADIPKALAALPDETRHWTQRLPEGWFKQQLLLAVPRLRYAY